MGTQINDLPVTKITDGDTIKVQLRGEVESIRLACVDTEESLPGGGKPVTNAGKAASAMAKEYFAKADGSLISVSLEFDTDDPVDVSLNKHRDNYGRLIAYVHKGDENYNLKLLREGFSPYFVKYGRSRVYHEAFMAAEAQAQAHEHVIWDPLFNSGGPSRDYRTLLPWWSMRDGIVQDYRTDPRAANALSVRLDYRKILEAAAEREHVTVLCDIQQGVERWPGDGALIFAGSKHHRFNLWIPNATSAGSASIIRLIERRYAGEGQRGYVYVCGEAKTFNDTPEIVLKSISQLSDHPLA